LLKRMEAKMIHCLPVPCMQNLNVQVREVVICFENTSMTIKEN